MLQYNSARTAIFRTRVSIPTRFYMEKKLVYGDVLHHGCGMAVLDSVVMEDLANKVVEYDPHYVPNEDTLKQRYNVVVSNFVLNVLPPIECRQVIKQLKEISCDYVLIAVRSNDGIKGKPIHDGFLTKINTFQRSFTIRSLKKYLLESFDNVEVIKGSDKARTIIVKAS